MINEGKNIILEIDVQGALNVKKNCEDGVFIYTSTINGGIKKKNNSKRQ